MSDVCKTSETPFGILVVLGIIGGAAATIDIALLQYGDIVRSVNPMYYVAAALVLTVVGAGYSLAKIQKWSGSKAFPADWKL
jgi:hypothetical protein